jgi:hypothetical protein
LVIRINIKNFFKNSRGPISGFFLTNLSPPPPPPLLLVHEVSGNGRVKRPGFFVVQVHDGALRGLGSLRTLDLSRNGLVALPAALFLHTPDLRQLKLDTNRHARSPLITKPNQSNQTKFEEKSDKKVAHWVKLSKKDISIIKDCRHVSFWPVFTATGEISNLSFKLKVAVTILLPISLTPVKEHT